MEELYKNSKHKGYFDGSINNYNIRAMYIVTAKNGSCKWVNLMRFLISQKNNLNKCQLNIQGCI